MSPGTPHGAQKQHKGCSAIEQCNASILSIPRKFPKHSTIKRLNIFRWKKKTPPCSALNLFHQRKKKKWKKNANALFVPALPHPPTPPTPLTFFVCNKSFIAFNGSDSPATAMAVCKSSSIAAWNAPSMDCPSWGGGWRKGAGSFQKSLRVFQHLNQVLGFRF